jgi:hypothetical protein
VTQVSFFDEVGEDVVQKLWGEVLKFSRRHWKLNRRTILDWFDFGLPPEV